jgi:hypothetical protein
MKIRFERNRRYIFIEMKSLFLNFLDLILPDTPVALLRFKDENRRELYYFLELNIEIQLLVKSTKEEKNS